MDFTTMSFLIALTGCAVGLAGWLMNRDKRTGQDSEWRGMVAAKLDSIYGSVTGLRGDIERIDKRMNEHAERLAKVEASCKQAHYRMDKMEGMNDGH